MFAKNSKRVIVPYDAGVQGNSNNFYYDSATGEMYYWNGTEYVAWGGEFEETTTTIETITDGFSYTNENGDVVEITQKLDNTDPQNQKIQTFVDGVKVFEFPLYTVNNDIQINNAGSEWDLTDDKITIVETNGDSQEINFPYRVTMVTNANGSIDVKQNGVTVGTIPAPFKESRQWHVDKNGNDTTGTGADENPLLTIAKALTSAPQSHAIIVNEGTYTEAVTLATPNQTLRGQGQEYGGLTEINSLSATANGTSVRASSLTVLGTVTHSGTSPLYLSEMTVSGNYTSSSTAYTEIKDSRLQDGTISKTAAGILFIQDSLIGNATFSTPNSVISLRNVTIDAGDKVTIGAGVIYNLQDVVGDVEINAGAIPLEMALLAQGATAEQSKAGQTSNFNMLRMLDPDTNASPTKFVSYNQTTKRLEISDVPVGGNVTYSNTNKISGTDTGTEGQIHFTTSNGTDTGTVTKIQVYDSDSNTWFAIEAGSTTQTTTSLLPRTGNGTTYVDPTLDSDNTLVDVIQLSDGSRVHNGKVTWTGHGLPIHTYFYASATAPFYTATPPSSGYSQQLFYTDDANTILIDIEEGVVGGGSAQTFAKNVYFNATNPTSATIFDLENPPLTNDDTLKEDSNNLYIGTNGQTWTYNSSTDTYSTYVIPTTTKAIFKARYSSARSISNGSIMNNFTNIQINTVPTAWNNATGNFTAPASGYYLASAELGVFGTLASGAFIEIGVYVNNVIQNTFLTQANSAVSGSHLVASGAVPIYMAQGDVFRYQIGTQVVTTSHVNSTYFSIIQL
jgi:hypothetical protein